MATIAEQFPRPLGDIDTLTVQRWQRLFGFSEDAARSAIQNFRADISRRTIPDELWETIRKRKETAGFDKEAYEYYSSRAPTTSRPQPTTAIERGTFLVKLDHVIRPDSL
jgi:hypothetical protein